MDKLSNQAMFHLRTSSLPNFLENTKDTFLLADFMHYVRNY